MKFLHQSAFSALKEGNSEARHIYLAQGDRPSRRAQDPDAAEVANLDALKQGVIGEAREAERTHLLQTTVDAAIDRVSGDINAIRRFNGFEVGEDGSVSVIIYRSIGGTERTSLLFSADDVKNSGFTTDELLTALNDAAPRFAETGAFAPDVDPGAARVVDLRTADPNAAPVGNPDKVVVTPVDPNAAPVVPLLVPRETAPENFADAVDVEALNASLPEEIEERVVEIERDELTGNYLVTLNEGAPLIIPAAEAGTLEDLTTAILDNLGVMPTEITEIAAEAAAPTVEAIMDAYAEASDKGGILTQVNEAMGYARGSADRITSIWGNTQARLAADPALRIAFGEALALNPEATVAEPVEAEQVVPTAEVVAEAPVASLDLDAMKDSEILDLVDSLDALSGKDLQKRLNELADQLGLTFPDGRYVENGRLVVDGDTGRTTQNAQRQVVEFLESHIPEEADHYISVLNDLEDATSVDEILNAVSGNQVQARMLQRDLKLLGFYNGGIDGVLGAGSRRGLTEALADERFENVYQIETAAREAEVIAEGERHGRRNPSVDALVAKIKAGEQITAADVAFTGREQGGSADRTREVMDFIDQAMADGEISNVQASQILELMMAEDSYPEDMDMQERIAATLHDASGRFIVGLSSIDAGTRIREVSSALRNRVRGRESRAQLAADMMANNGVAPQSFGAVDYHAEGVDPIVKIDGQEFDMRTLTKMYIITGGGQTAQGRGAVEVPIGPMSSALNVHNLVYRDGALVGTMENGCEGNLVVIPVNRQYVRYVPPAPVPQDRVPRGPNVTITPDPDPEPEIPVTGGHCEIVSGHCFGRRRAFYRVCYDAFGNQISRTRDHYEPDPTCESGDGDDGGDGCNGCGAGTGATDGEGTGGDGL